MGYDKGLKTRDKIIEISKELFYEKGFKKTRVTEICEISEVKGGTLTYYFNTKKDIVNTLYGELLVQCDTFVEQNTEASASSFEKGVIAGFLFNLAVFKNKKTVHFHHEVNLDASASEYIAPHLKKMYTRFNLELNLNLNEEDNDEILLADAGMRRELTLYFIKQKGYTIKESDIILFAQKEYLFMGRLFLVEPQSMEKNIAVAKDFIKNHDLSAIKLLL
ncbi:MAG: TetR/AcrR family transcriptional regulator [Eubacterium sp.]